MRFKKSAVAALAIATAAIAGLAVSAAARPGQPATAPEKAASAMCGHGMGPGGEPGMGPGSGHGPDMMEIHFLFAHRDEIRRTVAQVPGGVRTTTESDNANVAAQLRAHVRAMYARLKEDRPINTRDPLFAALFRNADKISARIEDTPKGLTVTETASDPEVTALIRKHADVVGQFIANGMHEMMRSH